jgi:hypothetical protein
LKLPAKARLKPGLRTIYRGAGKKDLAYARIYAYVRFLVWLRMGELEFSAEGEDGGQGYYVMG